LCVFALELPGFVYQVGDIKWEYDFDRNLV